MKNAWFTHSLDGGAFVSGDLPDTPFFRDQLPEHLHSRYYLLFLLVLHQRFALMKLSRDVAECWHADMDERKEAEQEAAVIRIRSAFLLFTARGYFAQVMQQEHHHQSYRRWQETFQIERLYREVSDEVREMSRHVLERRTQRIVNLQAEAAANDRQEQVRDRRREAFLGVLAGVLGGPALVLSFLDAIGPVSVGAAIAGSVIGIVGGIFLIILFLLWLQRQ